MTSHVNFGKDKSLPEEDFGWLFKRMYNPINRKRTINMLFSKLKGNNWVPAHATRSLVQVHETSKIQDTIAYVA